MTRRAGFAKVIIIVAIVLAVLAGVGFVVAPKIKGMIQARMPGSQPTIVRLEEIRRGDLAEFVSAPGQIEPETMVEISARVSAHIVEMPFEEGDPVKAGDLLVRLDATDLEAGLRAANARRMAEAAGIEVAKARISAQKASIAGIEASLHEATLNRQRQEDLLKSADVSQAVVDTAVSREKELIAQLESARSSVEADEMNLLVMEHTLAALEAEIDRAEDELSYTTIRSPIDGVIIRLNAEVGELVMTGTMNNPGTVILVVANLDRMLLVAQVDEANIGSIEIGQPATVRINAYRDREFSGVVETIGMSEQQAGDGSKYYETDILIDTEGTRIYSGLTADVEIHTFVHKDVLQVPSQAVLARRVDDLPYEIRNNNPDVDMTKTLATVVYVYENEKAIVRPVTIGASNVTHTVILSGLDEGERIIVGPYKELEGLTHEKAVKDEQVAQQEAEAKKAEEAAAAESEESGETDVNGAGG